MGHGLVSGRTNGAKPGTTLQVRCMQAVGYAGANANANGGEA